MKMKIAACIAIAALAVFVAVEPALAKNCKSNGSQSWKNANWKNGQQRARAAQTWKNANCGPGRSASKSRPNWNSGRAGARPNWNSGRAGARPNWNSDHPVGRANAANWNAGRPAWNHVYNRRGSFRGNIDARQTNIDNAIQRGISSGRLTGAEADRLTRMQSNIDQLEARYRATDNRLSPSERARLNAQMNSLSSSVRKELWDRDSR